MNFQVLRTSIVWFITCGLAAAEPIVVNNAEELIEAVRTLGEEIIIEGEIHFHKPYEDSVNALPHLFANHKQIHGRDGAAIIADAPGFRLIEITHDSRFTFSDLEIRGFSSPGHGGAIRVEDSHLRLNRVVFSDNAAQGHGGAIHAQGDVVFHSMDSVYDTNRASRHGGAIHVLDGERGFELIRNRFLNNTAGVGCTLASSEARTSFKLFDNLIHGSCGTAHVRVVQSAGGEHIYRNTWQIGSGTAYRLSKVPELDSGPSRFHGNILAQLPGAPGSPLCQITASQGRDAVIESHGANISSDFSCGFARETDLQGVAYDDVFESMAAGTLRRNGLATDVLRVPRINRSGGQERCSVADVRGLGRPQDGDGDGLFACDIGAVEKQEGPDIGPAQSGAYFDPERPGEGYFIEMLDNGQAWVTFFTFTPTGGAPPVTESFPRWHFGTGRVVGNSIVLEEFPYARGTSFGEAFDADDLHSHDIGGLSLTFPTCESLSKPGRAYFRSDYFGLADGAELSDVFTPLVRLSHIVGCDGNPANSKAGLSGTFFAPERSGEGVIVQWLDADRVLVIWYTFDLNDQQLWMISDGVTVDGNTVTAPMIYPHKSTGFGPNFDPAEIELAPWGTLTLDYSGCDTIRFSYDSVVAGYGSGSYTYKRLTRPAGTDCPEGM